MTTKTRSVRKSRRRGTPPRERCSFNRREAAYFADVSLRQIDKAIEEKVVKPWRPDDLRVYLNWDDVVTIALISEAGLQLPRKKKKQIYNWVKGFEVPEMKHSELALNNVLVLRIDTNIAAMVDRLDRYREGRERYIESDPAIDAGEPVIVGTRLPVRSVAARLERGDSVEDLVADYPGVPKTAFEAAWIYAKAHPRRGRPNRPWRDG